MPGWSGSQTGSAFESQSAVSALGVNPISGAHSVAMPHGGNRTGAAGVGLWGWGDLSTMVSAMRVSAADVANIMAFDERQETMSLDPADPLRSGVLFVQFLVR